MLRRRNYITVAGKDASVPGRELAAAHCRSVYPFLLPSSIPCSHPKALSWTVVSRLPTTAIADDNDDAFFVAVA